MKVTFSHSEDITKNVKTFWFKPEKSVDYVAGQFTEIWLPHTYTDERGDKRWFTLSSSPTENIVSITTKFTTQKGSSFKEALRGLKPGTELTLADPMGDFVLPKDPTIPLLFVAAGMGITPFRSIIKWLRDTREKRDIHLLYAVHDESELVFKNLFADYPLTFDPLIKSQGRVLVPEKVIELAHQDSNTLVYLSGPEPMVEDLVKGLQSLGVSQERLVTDYFHGYPAL